MDRLSDLPSCLIEMILCFMPIQEAGRTSILSREWRYHWTQIPKLVFEETTFQVSTVDGDEQNYLEPHERQKMDRSKLIYAVGQVLLMHDGSVDEFTLSLVKCDQRVKIDTILTILSKTSIKKLKLEFNFEVYRLPSSISSFHQLTDLSLIRCRFDHQGKFYGFKSLTSLYLKDVRISTRTLQHLLSSCPLLKTVILIIFRLYISRSYGGPTFIELLECLPAVETLSLSFDLINRLKDSANGRVPRELPTPLFHLKYLSINHVSVTRKEELVLAFLIRSSPNLEKLKISDRRMNETYKVSSSRVNCYTGIMLEHLNELEIKNFAYHKTWLDFVKLILARSPVLKKVTIFPQCDYHPQRFQILKVLLRFSRASPEVQFIGDDSCGRCKFSSAKGNKPVRLVIESTSM